MFPLRCQAAPPGPSPFAWCKTRGPNALQRCRCASCTHDESGRLTSQVFRPDRGCVVSWSGLCSLGVVLRPPGGHQGRCARRGRCNLNRLGPACCRSQELRARRAGLSPSSGMAAMLSAETMQRPSSCQCSCCSSSTVPTRRVIAASLGQIPTTRERRYSFGEDFV